MRKLLILMLVLGITSAANAALSIVGPANINKNDTATIGIISDSDMAQVVYLSFKYVSEGGFVLNAPRSPILPPPIPPIFTPYDSIEFELIFVSPDLMAGLWFEVDLTCLKGGVDVLVELYDFSVPRTLLDSLTIHQISGPYASNPDPADSAMIPGEIYEGPTTHIWTMLIFSPGTTAVKHTGYFSDDYSKVENRAEDANLGQPPYYAFPGWEYTFFVGNPAVPPAIYSLVRDTTYYWCVDETDGNNVVWQGPVWSFYVQSYYATRPDPPNEAINIDTDVLLSWRPCYDVDLYDVYDVYIGTSFDPVLNADEFDITGIYQGWTTEPNYQCSNLAFNTKYYWRVDAVHDRSFPGAGTIYKGDVWSFTTRPDVLGLFVDIDAAGANNGSSWADAFNHLQDALSMAWPGDEIYVAQGTYKPDLGAGITPGDRTATFQLVSGVTIKGGYAGFGEPDPNARDIELYETILSGDLSGNDVEVADPCDLLTEPTRAENSYHVVMGVAADETLVLDGFTIIAGNANGSLPHHGAGGVAAFYGDIINCTISGNSAIKNGGGMGCHGKIINCVITWNSAGSMGGGLHRCNAEVQNCIISWNWAGKYGGGMYNLNYPGDSVPIIENCIFSNNSAGQRGGGMYNDYCSNPPRLSNCKFTENSAILGGGMCNYESSTILTNCIFSGNSASQKGGGMFSDTTPCQVVVINCTFSHNSAGQYGGATCWGDESEPQLVNSIFYENNAAEGPQIAVDTEYYYSLSISYCNVQGGKADIFGYIPYIEWGAGNIDADPLFVDADGIDNIVGTEDDNLRLLLGSPCIDSGDNSVVTVPTDLDGNPRIRGGAVDMGAYEACTIYHVDGVSGDNTNDGLTPGTAFKTIQRGINVAEDCEAVFVWPDVYNEEISFWGDAITVQSCADAAVVETDYGYAFSFFSAEGPNTVLSNFVIRNSQYGIYLINGSSPTLRHLTIVDNDFGISAFNGSDPDISHCILWSNYFGDLFREPVPLQARYSCIEEGDEGEGNISVEPGFVDASGGDYHLLSERGRYWPTYDVWVLDEVTSPCVDGGDPDVKPSNEPMPNGGRINMGAYGNTAYASMSEWPIKGDINHDGRFNFVDIAILLDEWLEELPWAQ